MPKILSPKYQRLLETLASNMGVAIQNARLFEAEQERARTGHHRRSAKSAGAELDTVGIYDAVGQKLREIFGFQDVSIYSGDLTSHTMTIEYSFEQGQKLDVITVPMNSLYEYLIIREDKTLVFNGDFPLNSSYGLKTTRRCRTRNAHVFLVVPVPHKKNATIRVFLTLQDVEGKTIFSDAHVRLLETLAASMSVALQNAHSFKAEQERVAELEIINSIQRGLRKPNWTSRLIVNLVGDRLKDVFNSQDLSIRWYNEKENAVHFLYEYEHGKRITVPVQQPPSPGGTFDHILTDRKPIVGNTAEITGKHRRYTIPGTDTSKSLISVPIVAVSI